MFIFKYVISNAGFNKPFIVNVAVIGYCVICVHHTLSDSVVFINKAELDSVGEYSLILFPLLSIL